MEFLIQYAFWVLFFLLVALILPRVTPVPDLLKAEFGPKAATSPQFYSFTSNFVSVFHAVVSLICSAYLLHADGLDYLRANTASQNNLFAFSCGYFTIDFLFGILQGYNDLATHFHHVFSISSFVYALIKGRYGDNLLWALVITEISNPFMLLSRNFEKMTRYQKLSFPFSIVFAGVFIYARTYLCTHFIPAMMFEPVSLYLKLQCSFLCELNRVHLAALGARHLP